MDRTRWGGRNRRRFFKAMSWSGDEGSFITANVLERPILNVCSGNAFFGDVRVDAYHPWPTIRADALELPFKSDSFAAVFMDPPWGLEAMRGLASAFDEAIRVAPVLYLYAPIVWGTSKARMSHAWLRSLPGLNHPVILARYERNGLTYLDDCLACIGTGSVHANKHRTVGIAYKTVAEETGEGYLERGASER